MMKNPSELTQVGSLFDESAVFEDCHHGFFVLGPDMRRIDKGSGGQEWEAGR